jgi:hypothetical protein
MSETLRDCGQEKLIQAQEQPRLRQRHRHWYAGLARRADTEMVSPRRLDTPAGIGITRPASATAFSAYPPKPPVEVTTRRPARAASTPGPTMLITPPTPLPGTKGGPATDTRPAAGPHLGIDEQHAGSFDVHHNLAVAGLRASEIGHSDHSHR